jgi:hypothetical protein
VLALSADDSIDPANRRSWRKARDKAAGWLTRSNYERELAFEPLSECGFPSMIFLYHSGRYSIHEIILGLSLTPPNEHLE